MDKSSSVRWRAAARPSAQPLDDMRAPRRSHVATGIAAAAVVCLYGCASSASRTFLLKDLQTGLASARALPPGSRPAPPRVELRALEGASRRELRQAIGEPTYCGEDQDDNCDVSRRWRYEWGPPSPPPREASDGSLIVTTGGPFVIVIDFAGDLVSAAQWQGQR